MLSAEDRNLLYDALATRIHSLQGGYLSDSPAAKGTLAGLRRGTGDPQTWGEVVETLPPELAGRGDAMSLPEQAAAAALQFYALHQQGRTEPMHRPGTGLGQALRAVIRSHDAGEAGINRRLSSVLTATTLGESTHHLRGLVTQLRSAQQPVDHARLGVDIALLADPRTAQGVRLRWVRAFRAMTRGDQAPDPNPTAEAPATSQEG